MKVGQTRASASFAVKVAEASVRGEQMCSTHRKTAYANIESASNRFNSMRTTCYQRSRWLLRSHKYGAKHDGPPAFAVCPPIFPSSVRQMRNV